MLHDTGDNYLQLTDLKEKKVTEINESQLTELFYFPNQRKLFFLLQGSPQKANMYDRCGNFFTPNALRKASWARSCSLGIAKPQL